MEGIFEAYSSERKKKNNPNQMRPRKSLQCPTDVLFQGLYNPLQLIFISHNKQDWSSKPFTTFLVSTFYARQVKIWSIF